MEKQNKNHKTIIQGDNSSSKHPSRVQVYCGENGFHDFHSSLCLRYVELYSCVKPYGYFTQVGQPINGELTINNFNMIFNRVNFNGSLIGVIPETPELMNYCAENKIYHQIQMIKAEEINDAWNKVVNKEVRYRYLIDAETI